MSADGSLPSILTKLNYMNQTILKTYKVKKGNKVTNVHQVLGTAHRQDIRYKDETGKDVTEGITFRNMKPYSIN